VCNYLSLLGWAPDDGREVMDVDDVVAAFSLDGVTHAAAAFDHAKLDWMNGEWIRRLTLPELEAKALPLAQARFGALLDGTEARSTFREALRIGQERAVTIGSLLDQAEFLFVADDELVIEPASWDKVAKVDRVTEILDAVIGHVEACDWTLDGVDLRPALEALGVKPGKVMKAIYAAVEGRAAGLPLFDSILLLGRERTLVRLRAARRRLD
jgi:glutamyl-tRNA synthetase